MTKRKEENLAMKMRKKTNGTADNGSVTVFPAADRSNACYSDAGPSGGCHAE